MGGLILMVFGYALVFHSLALGNVESNKNLDENRVAKAQTSLQGERVKKVRAPKRAPEKEQVDQALLFSFPW